MIDFLSILKFVATNESIVAILGFIIPEPFATPVMVIYSFFIFILLLIILACVSVVIIDFERFTQLSSFRELYNFGIDSQIFLYFILSPITPVEKTKISLILQFDIFLSTLQ